MATSVPPVVRRVHERAGGRGPSADFTAATCAVILTSVRRDEGGVARPRVVEGDLPYDEKPIGAPRLPTTRRDRFGVWLHEHQWAQAGLRIAGGLVALGVAVLVFGSDVDWVKLVIFIVGAAFAGEASDREERRGGEIVDELLGDYEPRESLPAEFGEHVHRRPDPRREGRYFGGGF